MAIMVDNANELCHFVNAGWRTFANKTTSRFYNKV